MKLEIKVGQRFGKLVIIKEIKGKNRRQFQCLCDCGNICNRMLYTLRDGDKKNCGCLNIGNTIHGMSETRFYDIFINMRSRCEKPKNCDFRNYGGRGIKCLWKSFEEFRDDMYDSYESHIKEFGRKNTTIERKDNNGNYYRKNCRWATQSEQASNRRDTVFFEFNGEKHCIKEWAKIYKINYLTLYYRIYKYQWSIKEALTSPKKTNQFG